MVTQVLPVSKTINFVDHGIVLLMQYLNLWSAVWVNKPDIIVAYVITIL